MNTIQSEFNRLGVKKSLQEEKKQYQKPRSKKKMSTREIEGLMGKRREIYVRRNGAVRRK